MTYRGTELVRIPSTLTSGGKSLRGATIYVGLFPCNECAKAIIQSGIKEVVYLNDKYANEKSTLASKRLLGMAGVKLRRLTPREKNLVLSFENELDR